MTVHIDGTEFGSITIDGTTYNHDVVIRVDGHVEKRKKKLSKRIHGTSHTLSRDEAKFVRGKNCQRVVIGTGQHDSVRLSPEAEQYFAKRDCEVVVRPTSDAIREYNASGPGTIGLFHVTC